MFRNLRETDKSYNGLSAEAERDKSRPYAVRQITTLSRLVEDTKIKGMFFSNAYILKQTVSHYWLYVPVVPIDKGLQSFQSVFT